jgi:protein transport protein SEC24
LPVYFPRAAVLNGETAQNPPPADSRYIVKDDGNASPNLVRASVYAFPLTRALWHQTGDLPLGILATPLACHDETFVPRPRVLPDRSAQDWRDPQRIPCVDAREPSPPPRCGHCHAYANPFFGTDGSCNLCGTSNRGIAANLTGPAMQCGTVDYHVSGPYVTRPQPVPPVFVYAVDLTCPHVTQYLPILAQLGEDLATHVGNQSAPLTPRIGLCWVSSAGILVAGHHDRERYSVMADVTNAPFCPLPLNDWTFDVSVPEGLAAWKAYLDGLLRNDLEDLRKLARAKNAYGLDGMELSCGGAALAFLADALAATGGRGTLITRRRPNFGVGSLSVREPVPGKAHDPDNIISYSPLQTASKLKHTEDAAASSFYQELAAKCCQDRTCLDVLYHTSPLTPPAYLDLATLGELCRNTCGKLFHVSNKDWNPIILEELRAQVFSFTGWDAVFKVRCSDGIQIKSFPTHVGNLVDNGLGSSSEIELSCVTPNTCIAVELEHRVGGVPPKNRYVYIQTALLYSTISGCRRVRVSTLAIRSSTVVDEVFRSVDMGTASALLAREALDRMKKLVREKEGDAAREKARDLVFHRCLEILLNYRTNSSAANSSARQMVLPEKLQLFPLYCMCLMKSPIFRPGMARRDAQTQAVRMSPTGDDRALFVHYLANVSSSTSMLMVHPNIFSVLGNESGTAEFESHHGPEQVGFVRMPQPILPSMASLEDDGVYLLDSGLQIFFYVGKTAPDEIKEMARSHQIDQAELLHNFVWQMRTFNGTNQGSEGSVRPTHVPVVSIIQQDGHDAPMEADVLNLLVDDAVSGEKDYNDFLCGLHQRIQDRLKAK